MSNESTPQSSIRRAYGRGYFDAIQKIESERQDSMNPARLEEATKSLSGIAKHVLEAVPKIARNGRRACLITAAARRLAVERGRLGITNSLLQEATKKCSAQVGTALAKMTARGELVTGKQLGHYTHWFANAELARRWEATTAPKMKPAPTPRQRIKRQPEPVPSMPAPAGHAAPVTIGRRPDRTDSLPITPAGVKLQRLPAATHDDRYQCAPGARPFGAGFAAAGVGRDVTTGRQWEPSA